MWDDPDLKAHEYRYYCKYPGASETLLFIILGWKAILILTAIVLTFLVRSVSRTFNESKHLSLAIYDCAFVFGILIPLIAVLDDVEAEYLIECLGLIFGSCCAFLIIMLPKFWVIIRGNDDMLSPSAVTKVGSSNSRRGGTLGGTSATD